MEGNYPCSSCPLDAVISVAESYIEGFHEDSAQYVVTSSIKRQVALARFGLNGLAERLKCQQPVTDRDNTPLCPMPLNSFMALTEQRGQTVGHDGYPFDKDLNNPQASESDGDGRHGSYL